MVITKIKIVVQIWGRVTLRFIERDRGVSMTKLNSDAGTFKRMPKFPACIRGVISAMYEIPHGFQLEN